MRAELPTACGHSLLLQQQDVGARAEAGVPGSRILDSERRNEVMRGVVGVVGVLCFAVTPALAPPVEYTFELDPLASHVGLGQVSNDIEQD